MVHRGTCGEVVSSTQSSSGSDIMPELVVIIVIGSSVLRPSHRHLVIGVSLNAIVVDHDNLLKKSVGPFLADSQSCGTHPDLVAVLSFVGNGLPLATFLAFVREPILHLLVCTAY